MKSGNAGKPQMTNGTLKNISILCVDNYIDSLEWLRLFLELQGARVYMAVSAEEAVRVFAKHRPDILISDLALPEADGISLLKGVRNADPEMPAIALTGISDAGVREQAMKAGFDYYLVKPVDDDVLIQTVSALAMRGKKRCGI
jgi:two-component system CheB/CheR fusion protein